MNNTKNSDSLTNQIHTIWANKITHVLTSDDVDETVTQILADVFINAANEADIGIDAPKLIKMSFPLVMNRLNAGYQRGILHSLQSIIESGIPESVFDEPHQYEIHYSSKTNSETEKTKSNVLQFGGVQ